MNKEERKGIYCRKVSQFPSTRLLSGNDKGLQERQGGKKIYLGSKFQSSVSWKVRERTVISKPNPYTKDMKRIYVHVTQNLSFEDKKIVHHFSLRWRTEGFNRDAKDNLAFD